MKQEYFNLDDMAARIKEMRRCRTYLIESFDFYEQKLVDMYHHLVDYPSAVVNDRGIIKKSANHERTLYNPKGAEKKSDVGQTCQDPPRTEKKSLELQPNREAVRRIEAISPQAIPAGFELSTELLAVVNEYGTVRE